MAYLDGYQIHFTEPPKMTRLSYFGRLQNSLFIKPLRLCRGIYNHRDFTVFVDIGKLT